LPRNVHPALLDSSQIEVNRAKNNVTSFPVAKSPILGTFVKDNAFSVKAVDIDFNEGVENEGVDTNMALMLKNMSPRRDFINSSAISDST